MSDNGVYEQPAEHFPASAHKTKSIGGANLTYVDGEMVVSRLNEVLGVGGWSFEVKDIKVLEDEVWALGRITVYGPDRTIVREQAGGQIINRKRGTPATPYRPAQPADGDRPAIPAVEAQPAIKGDIIELSNDIKGAITDCLKKCATLIGVGLYLFNPTERREVEQAMQEAKRQPQRPAPPKSVADAAVLTGAEPTPIKSQSTAPEKKLCDPKGFLVGWHTTVKNTRFDNDEVRHKFIEWYTNGAYTSLTEFLGQATSEQATALIKSVSDRIAHEAKKAAS